MTGLPSTVSISIPPGAGSMEPSELARAITRALEAVRKEYQDGPVDPAPEQELILRLRAVDAEQLRQVLWGAACWLPREAPSDLGAGLRELWLCCCAR